MKINLDLGDTRLIIRTADRAGILRNQLAYILATAFWETNRTVKPVIEAYWLSEAWREKNLRYYPWHGRGYVQLTWQKNYLRAGKELDVDLTTDPEAALEPEIAAKILVHGSMRGWFTGKRLSDFVNIHKSNFISARRVINGNDKAREVAEIAQDYDAALLSERFGVIAPPADYAPDPHEAPAPFWAGLISALVSFFRKGAK